MEEEKSIEQQEYERGYQDAMRRYNDPYERGYRDALYKIQKEMERQKMDDLLREDNLYLDSIRKYP